MQYPSNVFSTRANRHILWQPYTTTSPDGSIESGFVCIQDMCGTVSSARQHRWWASTAALQGSRLHTSRLTLSGYPQNSIQHPVRIFILLPKRVEVIYSLRKPGFPLKRMSLNFTLGFNWSFETFWLWVEFL